LEEKILHVNNGGKQQKEKQPFKAGYKTKSKIYVNKNKSVNNVISTPDN